MFRIEFWSRRVCESICLSPPGLELGGSKDGHVESTYALADFFVQNSIPNNFHLKLFSMWCVFLAALCPKLNAICRFCTLLYFNHISLSSPLTLLQGEIDICACGLFWTKFNSKQLLYKAFFLWCVFLAALSPKLNVFCRFSIQS